MNERIVTKYHIITSTDGSHEISEVVNDYLTEGWTLLGSPKFYVYADRQPFWYQTVVKYSNELVKFHGSKDK